MSAVGFVSSYNKAKNYLNFRGQIDFTHPSPDEIRQNLTSYNSKTLGELAKSVKAATKLLSTIIKWADGPKPNKQETLADCQNNGCRRLQCYYFSASRKQSLRNSLETENRVLKEIRARMAEFLRKSDFLQ